MMSNNFDIKTLYFNSAENYLKTFYQCLLGLEKDPANIFLINEAFRAAHSMKSESLTMQFNNIGLLCHKLEDIFAILKQKPNRNLLGSAVITELLEAIDDLGVSVRRVKQKGEESDVQERIIKLKHLEEILKKGGTKNLSKRKDARSKDRADLKGLDLAIIDTINVKTQILDNLMNLLEELVILKLRFDRALEEKNFERLYDFKKHLALLLSELQYSISQARLIPISQIVENFPRLVRDMSRVQGKNVVLEIKGLDLRIDRTIADRLVEPLVHLLRNSVDHGIESPAERKKLGKPAEGKIQIIARREKDRAVLEIFDDGCGFDFEKIRKAILKNYALDEKEVEKMDKSKILSLLYQGGVSTSETVTSYSGRGMGLYAVKSTLDLMGGSLTVETQTNFGTHFILEFPLSLAIIKALLVEMGEEKFAIPTVNIIQSMRLTRKEIKKAADLDTFILNGEEIGILDLGSRLLKSSYPAESKYFPVVVVEYEGKKIGFLVHKIIGLEELTVKPLTQFPILGTNFSGATVLGDGKVALIIDIPAIFNYF